MDCTPYLIARVESWTDYTRGFPELCGRRKGMEKEERPPSQASKFLDNPGMTTEELYTFFYGTFIPVLQSLSGDMGTEAFIKALTRASVGNVTQMVSSMAKDLEVRDIKALAELYRSIMNTPPYNKAFTCEVAEQTDRILEMKFTECLSAKLLRAMGATDIGCALECSGGEGVARAFNSKLRFTNPKNMMRDDSHCIERFVIEE
jgi:hypothetical protein